MKRDCAAVVASLALLVLVAVILYGECARAGAHPDFAAEHEHEASSIHCPILFLNSTPKVASTIQFHSRNTIQVAPSTRKILNAGVFVAWFKGHSLWEPFSRQALIRFEEVYRL